MSDVIFSSVDDNVLIMNVLSWNVRGLYSGAKKKSVSRLIKQKSAAIISIQEVLEIILLRWLPLSSGHVWFQMAFAGAVLHWRLSLDVG